MLGEGDLSQALGLREEMLEWTVIFVVPELLSYEMAN